MKIRIVAIIAAAVSIALGAAFSISVSADSATKQYNEALGLSIRFYDANRCGKDVEKDNSFAWRHNCHTDDGKDVGLDLSGGYHDAGDHVKFGLTQGFSASVIAWSYVEFPDAFKKSGSDEKTLLTIRRFSDYFLKCGQKPGVFYYQVGDGGSDHSYWGSPEKQPGGPRTTCRFADAKNPASDILGETSAALALSSIIFKTKDPAYSDKCLKMAKDLYAMGKATRGAGDHSPFYKSSSYLDDMSWGAVWLHIATKDKLYLDDVRAFLAQAVEEKNDPFVSRSTISWDDMYVGVILKMADITKDKKYIDAIAFNLDHWINKIKKTAGGLRYYEQWGVVRYAAASSMVAILYSKFADREKYINYAYSQVDYILGKNPAKLSYLIGFGPAYPKDPHHRASICCRYEKGRTDKDCELIGALVGGPDEDDYYEDNMDMYQFSEVAIDYNAGLVGALAGLSSLTGK